MYEQQLQKLGLTAGEAKVYEALLALGSSTVGPILKKSGVAYSKVYHILNRLMDKGFVSFVLREKTRYFSAVEPAQIREHIERQEQQLAKNKEMFEKLLPELEMLKASGKKEEAQVFIGEKGLMAAYDNLLRGSTKTDQGIFFYVHDKTYYKRAERFYIKSWSVVKKFGNAWRGVANQEFMKTKLARSYPSFIKQRYVSFPLPSNIDVIGNKALITVWREKPIGILVESEELAENLKQYFEAVWEMANP